MPSDCVFCRIIAGDLDGRVIYQDELVTAFRDIHPAAPVHILIVPNEHIRSLNEVNEQHQELLGKLIMVAKELAIQEGVDEDGYRLLINTGPDAGQSVFHMHVHLIAGKHLPVQTR